MTNKTNGNGTQGGTTQPKNGTAVNKAVPRQLTEAEKVEMERQAQLAEQQKHFDGLYRLTTMRQRYADHKEAVQDLTITEDELKQFEVEKYNSLGIAITDARGVKYEIKHPYLVQLVCEFVATHFDHKVAECEEKILNYGKQ